MPEPCSSLTPQIDMEAQGLHAIVPPPAMAEFRFSVENIYGEKLTSCAIGNVQPGDVVEFKSAPSESYLARFVVFERVRSTNAKGEEAVDLFAVDALTGLVTSVNPRGVAPRWRIYVDCITARPPWWPIHWLVDASGTPRHVVITKAWTDEPGRSIGLPEQPHQAKWLAGRLRRALEGAAETLVPKPEEIAARSVLGGVDSMTAATQLGEERTQELFGYTGELARVTSEHLATVMNEALDQLFIEADAVARLSLSAKVDRRAEIAAAAKKAFTAGLQRRMGSWRGRPAGSAEYRDRDEFVAAVIRAIFDILNAVTPRSRIMTAKLTEVRVEKRLQATDRGDGRVIRRHIERFHLDWGAIMRAAREAYVSNAFILPPKNPEGPIEGN